MWKKFLENICVYVQKTENICVYVQKTFQG